MVYDTCTIGKKLIMMLHMMQFQKRNGGKNEENMSKKKNDENGFVFYRSFYDVIGLIPDEAMRCRAYTAICEYAFHGIEPGEDADVLVKMVFTQAKPQMDANNRRRENGKAGGEAKKANHMTQNQTTDVPHGYQLSAGEVPKEKEKDKVKDNAKEKENENKNKNKNTSEYKPVSAAQPAAERVISDGQTHFTPPTRTQVVDYLAEKELVIDADRFIDYYTSNGWMVGKNQMRDWKAAVRSWARQEERFQQNQPLQNTTGKRIQKGAEHNGNTEKMEPQFGLCL